jgi:hypothetical protein
MRETRRQRQDLSKGRVRSGWTQQPAFSSPGALLPANQAEPRGRLIERGAASALMKVLEI